MSFIFAIYKQLEYKYSFFPLPSIQDNDGPRSNNQRLVHLFCPMYEGAVV